MDEHELLWSGVTGQAAAVRDGLVSARELTAAVLAGIQQDGTGQLNAFTVVMAQQALAEADAPGRRTREPAARCTAYRWRSRRSSTSPAA